MRIAVIDTNTSGATPEAARAFLPKLLTGLTDRGGEVRLFTKDAPAGDAFDERARAGAPFSRSVWRLDSADEQAARDSARWLDEFAADVYLIWSGDALAWAVLPLLASATATVAVGHADSEEYYAPARHYRSFLTRVVGTTPETCVGFVINCVIEKERVEWISGDGIEDSRPDSTDEELQAVIETYATCLEKARADALAAPREASENFPPLESSAPAQISWFEKLRSKLTG